MQFHSFGFLFGFLPITLLVAYAARQWWRLHGVMAVLIAASLLFYGWQHPMHLWMLIGSILGNYALTQFLIRKHSKIILWTGIAANLTLLAGFKYVAMLQKTMTSFAETSTPTQSIVLPLAVSFIVIQQVAYLVDTYRGSTTHKAFWEYVLFICFFPRLFAGPIVRWSEYISQVHSSRLCARKEDIIVGWAIALVGLTKKVVLADTLGGYAHQIFAFTESGAVPPPYYAWGAMIAFSLQLYFDFSGYSDMATGLARMFGMTLPENFHAPYRAQNISDFWRRWHMTLYRFLRDMLYIPLGGNRRGVPKTIRNIFIITLLAGLWHGMAWTFVLWGALHGIYLMSYMLWKKYVGTIAIQWKPLAAVWKFLSIGLTGLCVLIAWVPFRSSSLLATVHMFQGMLAQSGIAAAGPLLNTTDIQGWHHAPWWIAGGLLIVYLFPTTQEIFHMYHPVLVEKEGLAPKSIIHIPAWKPTVLWGIALAIMTTLVLHAMAWNTTPFLYFQF